MPPAITWEKVQDDFDRLNQAGVYAPLDSFMEKIEGLIKSRLYPPEVAKLLVETVGGMQADFAKILQGSKDDSKKKQALRSVVQEATNGSYIQSGWRAENVTNAQSIINVFVGSIKKEVEEPKPSIGIPVVLLVMTREEAKELDTGKIIVDMPKTYLNDFKQFKKLLKPGWPDSYGNTPQEWKPFDSTNKSIKDWMTEVLAKVGQLKGYMKPLVPVFIDIHALKTNREALRYMRSNGCFVINDVISMWHPVIQREYRSSLLDAFPSTVVFRTAPLDKALKFAQPLISFTERYEDLEFFKRKGSDLDLKCSDMYDDSLLGGYVMQFTPDLISPYDKVNSPLLGHIIGEDKS
jgi:hypothetical protein